MSSQKLKPILISIVFIVIFIGPLLYLNRWVTCSASDFDPRSPVVKTFSGFTMAGTCGKAIAVCSMFSPNPRNCKAINNEAKIR